MATEGWEDNPHLKKIYVAELKAETDKEKLTEYFGNYGTVTECNVIKDAEDKPRGIAFVSMDNSAIVDTILEGKPHTIDGQIVTMRRAIPRDDPALHAQAKTRRLFVGGLSGETTEQDILDVLKIFTTHEPESITVMKDEQTKRSKGFAFALFKSEDIVDKLFIIRTCTIKDKRVSLKKAAEIRDNSSAPRGGTGGRGGGFRGARGAPRGRGGQAGYNQNFNGGYNPQYYGGGFNFGYNSNGFRPTYGGGYGGVVGGYGAYGGFRGGFNMGQYSMGAAGYGPNRGGRGHARGGRGYRPY